MDDPVGLVVAIFAFAAGLGLTVWSVSTFAKIEAHLRGIREEVAALRGVSVAVQTNTGETAQALRRVAE